VLSAQIRRPKKDKKHQTKNVLLLIIDFSRNKISAIQISSEAPTPVK
jgi:hypothetical protein